MQYVLVFSEVSNIQKNTSQHIADVEKVVELGWKDVAGSVWLSTTDNYHGPAVQHPFFTTGLLD